MKKIAIITLHSVKNYGSALQAYATQCYFENLGLESEIIDYRRPWETKMGYWFYLTDKSLTGFAKNIMYFPSKVIQYFKFSKFKKNYLKVTKNVYKNIEDFDRNPIVADYYCTGSDQVWNSGWNNGVIPEYFLSFVNNDKKLISFASSFGNSSISEKDKKIIEPLLKKYNLITVREEASVRMLYDNFAIDSHEILDPTLQMSNEFWKSLCNSERKIKEKYVLLIQLNRNHEFDDIAKKFCAEKNIKLYRLCLRVDQFFLTGRSIVIPSVNDYVRLIRDADYVLTDSFHAVSFCLNLEKQFYVYYPNKYSERLKSILHIMNLYDRVISYDNLNDNSVIDFNKVRQTLTIKRKYTYNLFNEILKD